MLIVAVGLLGVGKDQHAESVGEVVLRDALDRRALRDTLRQLRGERTATNASNEASRRPLRVMVGLVMDPL